MPFRLLFTNFLILLMLSCESSEPRSTSATVKTEPTSTIEVRALSGRLLTPPVDAPSARQRKDSLLRIAERDLRRDSSQVEHWVWYGRRVAYLWHYPEAIGIYTEALKRFPESAELYRHRGHRYLSIRKFAEAARDFDQAAALIADEPLRIEPDGIPNRINQPLSNLQFNIYYHWGLAEYLMKNFEEAAALYRQCMDYSDHPDLKVATADWLYMTYRRLGEESEAQKLLEQIPTDWEMVENDSYYQRIKMYKGMIKPEALLNLETDSLEDQLDLVTQGYGVGNWYLYELRDSTRANTIFRKILDTDYWAAFGYIAAEAELYDYVR